LGPVTGEFGTIDSFGLGGRYTWSDQKRQLIGKFGYFEAEAASASEDPRDSEVMDGTHPMFYTFIERGLDWKKQVIEDYSDSVKANSNSTSSHIDWLREELADLVESRRWRPWSHFWNLSGHDASTYDRIVIALNPKKWFLINIDVHT